MSRNSTSMRDYESMLFSFPRFCRVLSHMQAPSPHEESKIRSCELEIESADPAKKPTFALKTGLTKKLNDRQILGTPRR
jgi:hypothetical protein